MNFKTIDRRLVLRYANPDASTFSFRKIRNNASNEGLMGLANAFASIQSEQPNRVTTVVTRQLI